VKKPACILIATDLSEHAGRAETRAAMLAQSLGAEKLVLLHVVPRLPLEALTGILDRTPLETGQRLVDAASAELAKRARRLGEQFGVAAETLVRIGRPHVEAAEVAETLDAGLLVAGGYGADLARGLFLGATAEKILSQSRRPVLVVKQAPEAPYRRLLAPTDFSPSSARALDWARAIAGEADITVAHVYEAPYESTLRYAGVSDEVIETHIAAARRQTQEALEAFLAPRRADGANYFQRILHGHPAAGIRELAEEMRPDLIVLGKHGQSEIEELLLGSVTRHVLTETPCDMLIARAA
jgi:nucleotide-binding universal stress UspA family protein